MLIQKYYNQEHLGKGQTRFRNVEPLSTKDILPEAQFVQKKNNGTISSRTQNDHKYLLYILHFPSELSSQIFVYSENTVQTEALK